MLDSVKRLFGPAQVLLYLFLVSSPLPIMADAGSTTITPYIGYRDGGGFEEASSGSNLDIDEGDAVGLIVGWDVDGGQFEVSYGRQATELTAGNRVAREVLVDVDISNLLIAGKLVLNPESGAYVSALLGLTQIDIDADELDSEIRPALGFGGGIDRRINDKLGLRVGLRGIATFLDTDADDLCDSSSDCPIFIDNSTLVQWEVFTGLSLRF